MAIKKSTAKDEPVLSAEELAELQELRQFKATKKAEENAAIGLKPEYQDYEVKDSEKHLAHLLVGFISKPNPHDRSKDELGRVLPHILDNRSYPNFLDNMVGMGYKIVKVLHLPEDGFVDPLAYFQAKEDVRKAKIEQSRKVAANQDAALVVK